MNWIKKVFNKKKEKQCAISVVMPRFTFAFLLIHIKLIKYMHNQKKALSLLKLLIIKIS